MPLGRTVARLSRAKQVREKRIKLGVLFRIPRELQRRGGRKRIIAPDSSEIAPADDPQPDGLFRLSGCIPPERTTTRTSRPVVPVLALGKRSGERCNCFRRLGSGMFRKLRARSRCIRRLGDGTKPRPVGNPS
jgi:hypothetical protein